MYNNDYIIDAFGSCPAVDNDAKILTTILNCSTDFPNLIMRNDLIVLDRGFRDCVQILNKEFGIRLAKPTCSQEQLTEQLIKFL